MSAYREYKSTNFTDLDDTLFSSLRNDLAFIVTGKLVVVIGQQSIINENMPLRLLLYVARIYEKMVAKWLAASESID